MADPNHNPKRVALNPDPETFESSFDLTTELAERIEFYRGDECVTLRPVPGYLKSSLDRYQSIGFTAGSKKPGINPITAACIYGGIQSFRSLPHVKHLIDHRDMLTRAASDTNEHVWDTINNWFGYFPVDLIPSHTSGVRSLNISMPPEIKSSLAGLSSELGMSLGHLASLCIAEILRSEPSTLNGHRERLDQSIDAFLQIIEIRADLMALTLERIDSMSSSKSKSRNRNAKRRS